MTRWRRLSIVPILWLAFGAVAPSSQSRTATPAALAVRVAAASEAERPALLTDRATVTIDLARELLAIGDAAREASDATAAARAFGAAVLVARAVGAAAELGRALNGRALSLFESTQLDRAAAVAEESRQHHERIGGADGLGEAWNTLGNIAFYRGDYAASMAASRHARDAWAEADDRRGVGRALNNLGNAHKALGQLDDAAGHYEQALAIFDAVGDEYSAGVVINNIALVHFNRGDYPLALEAAERGLAISRASGYRGRTAKSLDTIGNVYLAQGAYARALESFRQGLELRRASADAYAIAESEHNIGLVHFAQGDYTLAIAAYRRGLRTASRAGTAKGLVAEALTNIGSAAWRLGQLDRARANFLESLAIGDREGWAATSAANLQALGRLALERGRGNEARDRLSRALTLYETAGDHAGIAGTLNALARVDLDARRPAAAVALASRAGDLARRYEQSEHLWEAETLRGIAHRRLGEPEAARRSWLDAVAVVERLHEGVVPRPLGGARFFETRLSPYHELMSLMAATRRPEAALEIADRAKARGLADLLQGRDGRPGRRLAAGERAEERRLRQSLRALNERVLAARTATAGVGESRVAALEGERQAARDAYEAFQIGLYAKYPDLGLQRGGAPPFTMADAEALVTDPATAILHYAVTDDAAYLFVLSRRQGRVVLDDYRLDIGRRTLSSRVQRLRDRLAARDLLFAEDARAMYEVLLAPASTPLAGKTHVIVVPDGPLWETPFQALRDRADRYVLESAAISYAPSLAALRHAVRTRPPRTDAPTLLAIGKADFAAPGAVTTLARLPEAERQVARLAEIYGAGRSAIYTGAQATEERFKAEAGAHRVVHVASHGVFDEGSPLHSSIVLSASGEGSTEDGLLEAWELLDLSLDADLVVLSACETARGRVASGEGLVGTAWALLGAGARATVVSQWNVEATSTTTLMTAMHRRMVRGGGSRAEHLRQAALEVLRTPRYTHPFYWAAFVLVGDPF